MVTPSVEHHCMPVWNYICFTLIWCKTNNRTSKNDHLIPCYFLLVPSHTWTIVYCWSNFIIVSVIKVRGYHRASTARADTESDIWTALALIAFNTISGWKVFWCTALSVTRVMSGAVRSVRKGISCPTLDPNCTRIVESLSSWNNSVMSAYRLVDLPPTTTSVSQTWFSKLFFSLSSSCADDQVQVKIFGQTL